MKVQVEEVIIEVTNHIKYMLFDNGLAKDYKSELQDKEVVDALKNLETVLNTKIGK